MAGIAQNGQKRLIFILVPQVTEKMREKGKSKMDKSKEKNIYPYVYIYTNTHLRTYKHI